MVDVAAAVASATDLPFSAQPRDPAEALEAFIRAGMDPPYAQSLALTLIATSRSELEGDSVVDGSIERVTGRPGSDWAQYATRHRDRFINALR
jgi:hypothetical protein